MSRTRERINLRPMLWVEVEQQLAGTRSPYQVEYIAEAAYLALSNLQQFRGTTQEEMRRFFNVILSNVRKKQHKQRATERRTEMPFDDAEEQGLVSNRDTAAETIIKTEEAMCSSAVAAVVTFVLAQLPSDDAWAYEARYVANPRRTLRNIAEELGLTHKETRSKVAALWHKVHCEVVRLLAIGDASVVLEYFDPSRYPQMTPYSAKATSRKSDHEIEKLCDPRLFYPH